MDAEYEALGKNGANHQALSPLSFLRRTADIFPDRLAVIYEDRRYSWAETYARVRRLASALARRGIRKGDTVSIMAPNTPEMFEAHFGIPMADAVLNTINTRLEVETVAYILDHSDAKVVLVDSALSAVVAEALKSVARDILVVDIVDAAGPAGERIGALDYEALLAEGDPDFVWNGPADEWQALALNYTSGTSGRPKGVVYHHRGSYLMSMGTVVAWELPRHPTYLYTVPMFHCNGWGHAWTMTLLAGTIVCNRAVSAKAVFDAIHNHEVTHFGGAPIVLSMLIDAPEEDRKPLEHPVKVMTAGAPPPAAVLEKTRAMGFEVMQVYGLTETFGHVTQALWREDWDDLDFAEQAELQSWQGVSFPMNEGAAVIDRETGELRPRDGETQGEIVIRGNTVMKGYYKSPEATQEAFVDGWFRTGDAAVWHANGYIQIKDRLKDVIISGGENVSSVEVEGVLYRHPAVAAAAVVAKPDDKWGEVPCAFIELKAGERLSEEELIEFCRERMAGFKRPKKIVFGELPKTATGKIQKFVLREEARKA
ncbi:acyl-CoA synthetase [Denitrobaculum tricleocarpae]|uniref:3-methylmercaptopropionyl-CoA ligase n=1 Tax=Denitrobaculum tricleocarpae TaxID=2591009 RepID=A0A545TUP0_9PROT|nr:acyl-CoA synthetase [Denitrobaculum tricleocarpae]TQV80919.1 acyl-CoA synthetase [Denitrobaculum tricleocarpae]